MPGRKSNFVIVRALFAGFYTWAFFCLLSIPLHAQASSSPPKTTTPPSKTALPSADTILTRYIQAVGGRPAWMKLNSRVSTGTIKIMGSDVTGTVEIHEKAPDHMLTIISIGGMSFRQGFDGKIGWTEDAQNGVHEQTGAELAEAKRESDFYSALNFRNHYAKFAVSGSEKVQGQDAVVLEATVNGESDPDKIYFDAQSGLPVRIVGQHHSPTGTTWFVEDLGDYRAVDGVKLPFSIAQTTMDSEFTVEITEIHHNVVLDDSQFSEPAVQ